MVYSLRQYIVKTARKRLYALKVLRKSGLPLVYLIQVYCSLVQPILEFASPVWAALTTCLVQFVEGVEKSALRIIFPDFSYESPLVNCGLPTVLVRHNEACRPFTSNIKESSVLAHLLQQLTNVAQGCRLRSCFSVLNSALEERTALVISLHRGTIRLNCSCLLCKAHFTVECRIEN